MRRRFGRIRVRTGTAIAVCLGILIGLSGCWDQKEMNQLAIINMLGIDKHPDDPTLEYYYQTINPSGFGSKQGGGTISPVYTYKVVGKVPHASSTYEVSDILPRQVFPEHLQAIVLSETFARNPKRMTVLLNSYELQMNRRANVDLVITNSPMSSVMNTYVPFEKIPGKSLTQIIDIQAKGSARAVQRSRFKDLIEHTASTKATVINAIRVYDPKTDRTTKNLEKIDAYRQSFVLDGGAVFVKDRMVGKMSINDIKWYAFLTGNADAFLQPLAPEGYSIEVEAGHVKVKKSFKLANGAPALDFHITAELRMRSNNLPRQMGKDTLHLIEKAFNETAEKEAVAFINMAAAKRWDVLGLQDQIAYKRAAAWKKALAKDPALWTKTRYEVKVQSNLVTGGMLTKPYLLHYKEE
ncbi:Ger(x)C family spore germination protein [Paenibacillus sp. R14(2021)]|uniref:Ger(x)C family spore germination protein n=1 Tax=Paenibacillus sp. R14(2021) TaxID=2859228 RepID=UPI001C61482A|nr:Ger(x)C family spore germination protein [Paenibacillus sp. R14(2021)]